MMRQAMIARAKLAKLHREAKFEDQFSEDISAVLREFLTYIELLERKVDDLQGEVRRPAWWPGGPH